MYIVWRREWIRPYESAWSIFEKFKFANIVERSTIIRAFGIEKVQKIKGSHIGDQFRDLLHLKGLDPSLTEYYLSFDLHTHNDQTIKKILSPLGKYLGRSDSWFSTHLKWCKTCLQNGYHSVLHQFILFKNCPFHQEPLIENCPGCDASIPFLISDSNLGGAFLCKCGFLFSDASKGWNNWCTDINIKDKQVKKYLTNSTKSQNQYIIIQKYINFDLLNTIKEGIQYVDQFCFNNNLQVKNKIDLTQLYKDILYENSEVFEYVDKRIRKAIYKHKACISRLTLLLKEETADFPPACPFAYAYVFWRQSLLDTSHFYSPIHKPKRTIDAREGFTLISKIYKDELKQLFDSIVPIESEISNINIHSTKWVIRKAAIYLYEQHYVNWLNYSLIRKSLTHNEKIKLKKELVNENIAFGFSIKHEKNKNAQVKFFSNRRTFSSLQINDLDQLLICNQIRKKQKKMKSHLPQAVAMFSFNDERSKSKLNEQVTNYIKQLHN